MRKIKSFVKRIPLLGAFLIKIKRSYTPAPSPVKGINNIITNNGVVNKVIFDIIGNNNEISIGKNTSINNTLIFMRGDGHKLIIDENCYFGEGELWLEDNNCSLIIHANTTVERGHLAVTEPFSVLEIHKDCMLARHIEIRTGDSHSIIEKQTGKRINKAANVTLQEHVWVGAHAKILKGVTVGNNSVIGTASVVTQDVPPNSIVAGVPAKLVRSGIDWKRERITD